jgi:hypothetical protein
VIGLANFVALEFDFVLVATLDGGCENGVDGEQSLRQEEEDSFPWRRGGRTFARSCGRGGTLASGRGRSERTSSHS